MEIERVETSSVYQIHNRQTGDCYIGSTSGMPGSRWPTHIRLLRAGRHHSEPLQQAWNESKIGDWDFRLLEVDIPVEQQSVREAEWLRKLRPCYNVDAKPKLKKNAAEIETVLTLRKQGKTLRHIATVTEKSLGWVCSTLSRYREKGVQ